MPQTKGASASLGDRMMHGYVDHIIQLTTVRPDIRLVFLRTMHMLDNPSALFAPRVITAVLNEFRRRSKMPSTRRSWFGPSVLPVRDSSQQPANDGARAEHDERSESAKPKDGGVPARRSDEIGSRERDGLPIGNPSLDPPIAS
jgi:hypothetical protein